MDEDKTRAGRPESLAASQSETPGQEWVGKYRILQQVGEGGMGEVYMAEQKEPVRRIVALKLIKAGMDTKQVVARFESERQALALMSHPNIAQVLDAGATERGLPYFAMEYVKGEPITTFCNQQHLGTRERLELLIQVCDGVQHAHQKGIIHRDIKPTNVLVQIADAKPVPKIIDFGVAKATAQRLTDKTMFTQLGVMMGTPEYMSPEQAEMSGLDIDTRSDVYSLGVLLYELLVGALPFDSAELRDASFDEVRRKIREDDPPRPSTRVVTLGDDAARVERTHKGQTTSVARLLRGDLDWITMKALEKDRQRRYGSPTELAADIKRYLEDRPVLAGPPSTIYRARKWVRRHKFGAVAAGLLVLAVVAGLTGTTYGLVRATRAETEARNDAATAEQVSAFLAGLFKVSDPGEARGNSIKAREILDRGAERVREELADQPVVQSQMMSTIGDVYVNLGLYADAQPLLEEALSTRRQARGDDHLDVAGDMNALGTLLLRLGDAEGARPLLEQALAIREANLPPGHPDLAPALNSLGRLAYRTGDRERARTLFERALEIREAALAPDDPLLAESLYNLAIVVASLGEYERARELHERGLAIRETALGDDHPDVAGSMDSLANVLVEIEDYDAAQKLFEGALAILEKTLDPGHARLASTENNLARLLKLTGDYAGARAHLERALKINQRVFGPAHRSTVLNLYNLARLSALESDRDGALELLGRAADGGLVQLLEARGFAPVSDEPDLALLREDPGFVTLFSAEQR